MTRAAMELYRRIEINGDREITLKNGLRVTIHKGGKVYVIHSDRIIGGVKAYTDLENLAKDLSELNKNQKIY